MMSIDPRPYGRVQQVRRSYVNRQLAAWADLDRASATFRLASADAPAAVPVIAGWLRGGIGVLGIDCDLVSAYNVACADGSLSVRLDSSHVAVLVDLGPIPATAALRQPTWLGNPAPTWLGHFASGCAVIDLTALGMDPDDIIVTVWLSGALSASFARVALSRSLAEPHGRR